jgi:hypothetical protein
MLHILMHLVAVMVTLFGGEVFVLAPLVPKIPDLQPDPASMIYVVLAVKDHAKMHIHKIPQSLATRNNG